MESNATDKPVPSEVNALLSDERLILRETQRAVTPFGGIAVFISFLEKIGFVVAVRQHMPIVLRSPNHIDPSITFTAFLVSVPVGSRAFRSLQSACGRAITRCMPLGMDRFPTDDTIRNLFLADSAWAKVQRLYEPMAEWQMQRLPQRAEGYTLDLDSTVFERYGQQEEGSLKGHNPLVNTDGPATILSWQMLSRSAFPPPWLRLPQRQLQRHQPWHVEGISQRSSRAVGTARKDPPAES